MWTHETNKATKLTTHIEHTKTHIDTRNKPDTWNQPDTSNQLDTSGGGVESQLQHIKPFPCNSSGFISAAPDSLPEIQAEI